MEVGDTQIGFLHGEILGKTAQYGCRPEEPSPDSLPPTISSSRIWHSRYDRLYSWLVENQASTSVASKTH